MLCSFNHSLQFASAVHFGQRVNMPSMGNMPKHPIHPNNFIWALSIHNIFVKDISDFIYSKYKNDTQKKCHEQKCCISYYWLYLFWCACQCNYTLQMEKIDKPILNFAYLGNGHSTSLKALQL